MIKYLLILVLSFGGLLPSLVVRAETFTGYQGFKGGFEFVKEVIVPKAQVKDFGGDPVNFITAGLKLILSFVGLLAAVVLVWGGIKYIISLGDEDAAADAKRLILYAIIGLLIIGAAILVVNTVTGLFRA